MQSGEVAKGGGGGMSELSIRTLEAALVHYPARAYNGNLIILIVPLL